MKKILFLRSFKALYPEIEAYINYFNKSKNFRAFDSSKLEDDFQLSNYDVLWEIKGFGGVKLPDRVVVHEYASLSISPYPRLKNLIKSQFNPKPNLRIFLNETVRSGFMFNDNVNFCYRDMGIGEEFLKQNSNAKEYNFVYVGAISKAREMDLFLSHYESKSLGRICLIGPVEKEIYDNHKHNKDLIFTGKIDYKEVPAIASKAIYGLNLIPDKYPYNLQTSTKLLEYLALGLKIVTTDYKWVRNFENIHDCDFFKFNFENKLDLKTIDNHNFKTNFRAEQYIWDNVIQDSGIEERLLKLLNY